jgi:hypothetical protein
MRGGFHQSISLSSCLLASMLDLSQQFRHVTANKRYCSRLTNGSGAGIANPRDD